MERGPAAHDVLVEFWRRQMVSPVSGELFASFVAMAAPAPPPEPTPTQVVAYAELVVLAGDRALTRSLMDRARANMRVIRDEDELMSGVGEAVMLAEPLVIAGAAPREGPELDRFVAAHATVRGSGDTPEFRGAGPRPAGGPLLAARGRGQRREGDDRRDAHLADRLPGALCHVTPGRDVTRRPS